MTTSPTWIVCEGAGTWTAGLRASFAREPAAEPKPRLSEPRTLGELKDRLTDSACQLVLIEFRPDNLGEALQFVARTIPQQLRFVALLAIDLDHLPADNSSTDRSTSSLADLLWEIGAIEVIESPRQASRLIPLHSCLTAACSKETGVVTERPGLADWAWSCIPWQDA